MGSLRFSSLPFDGELQRHENRWMGRGIVGIVGWIVNWFSSPLAMFVGTGVFFSSHFGFSVSAIFSARAGRTTYQQSPPLAI
jgi:hypothetical protein